jgi:hypothetical protein
MSLFKSERLIPVAAADLGPVAAELAEHFRQRSYEVECLQVANGTWQVGVTRGGMFKAAVGLKSALKIEIERQPLGTMVRAGTGIFGKQAVPTAISMLVAWPVLLTQAWGLVQQAGLDGEAIRVVEMSLQRGARAGVSPDAAPAADADTARPADLNNHPAPGEQPSAAAFCTGCGSRLDADARFCASCGKATRA